MCRVPGVSHHSCHVTNCFSHYSDRQSLGRQFVEISSATRDQYYSAIARVRSFCAETIFFNSWYWHKGSLTFWVLTNFKNHVQHVREQEGGRLSSVMGSVSVMGEEGNRDKSREAGSSAALWSGSTPPSTSSLAAAAAYGDAMAQQQHYHPGMQPGPHMGMTGRGPPPPRGGLHAPLQKRTGGGIQVGEHTGFLRMRGLPFSASKEDIFRFFEGYNPVQESIVLTYRNDGRATGEAYVGFATPEDAKRAMDLHRRSMGSRYIELFISNKDEQGRALARFGNR